MDVLKLEDIQPSWPQSVVSGSEERTRGGREYRRLCSAPSWVYERDVIRLSWHA